MRGVRTGVIIALVGVLAGGGGAYAAGQITGSQIKDGTITAKDIKAGTITTGNLSAAAKRGMTGPVGPARPAGPKGDSAATVLGSPGAAGAKGDKGDQGPKGDKGDKGDPGAAGGAANVTEVVDTVPNSAASDDEWIAQAVATCPDGQRVISGAFFQDVESLGEVFVNLPDEEGSSWIVVAANWADPEGDFTDGELNALAYCVPSPQASKAPFAERHAAAVAQARELVAKYHKHRR